jgi:hypothetical protein
MQMLLLVLSAFSEPALGLAVLLAAFFLEMMLDSLNYIVSGHDEQGD